MSSLAAPSAALLEAVEAALPAWVERSVASIMVAYQGSEPEEVRRAAVAAGRDAAVDIVRRLRILLETDVDEQRTNPLSILRGAVRYPTEVLREAGVPPVVRDDFAERSFPDDIYGLAPATWRDVDESLHEPGLVWGAWKAKTVLDRRRAEGNR